VPLALAATEPRTPTPTRSSVTVTLAIAVLAIVSVWSVVTWSVAEKPVSEVMVVIWGGGGEHLAQEDVEAADHLYMLGIELVSKCMPGLLIASIACRNSHHIVVRGART
jgi:hypothetical protein